MNKIVFIVHGGASKSNTFIKKNIQNIENGLKEAVLAGYKILKRGGSALDAVEKGVTLLEDNPYFNAGRGSALNANGEVEMDASIMNGKNLKAGAVSIVRNVKNPISLARVVMRKTKHVFLSGYGALEIARNEGIQLEPDAYFITENQLEDFKKYAKRQKLQTIMQKKVYGTVGAVALDKRGNLAAGTSTGGTSNCLPGRIGDSCIIGGGCYAKNSSCAISGTGEGEYLIRGVVAHTISMMVEHGMPLQEACDLVLHKRDNNPKGEIGVIAVNQGGDIGFAFNTPLMKRAWVTNDGQVHIKIFK